MGITLPGTVGDEPDMSQFTYSKIELVTSYSLIRSIVSPELAFVLQTQYIYRKHIRYINRLTPVCPCKRPKIDYKPWINSPVILALNCTFFQKVPVHLNKSFKGMTLKVEYVDLGIA